MKGVEVQLLCLPYAGGSCYAYNRWAKYLDKKVKQLPMEIAGRGRRIREPYYSTVEEAVKDIEALIHPVIRNQPYILFGHSMGSILAYELCRLLHRMRAPLPVKLIVSGSDAPMIREPDKKYHLMEQQQLIEEMLELGGLSKEIASSTELMDLFLPILRADFAMLERYVCSEPFEPLPIDLTVMYGQEDEMIKKDVRKWGELVTGKFESHVFPGGHFYLFDHECSFMPVLNHICEIGGSHAKIREMDGQSI